MHITSAPCSTMLYHRYVFFGLLWFIGIEDASASVVIQAGYSPAAISDLGKQKTHSKQSARQTIQRAREQG